MVAGGWSWFGLGGEGVASRGCPGEGAGIGSATGVGVWVGETLGVNVVFAAVCLAA